MDYNIYNCKNCHSENLDHQTYTVMCKDCGCVEHVMASLAADFCSSSEEEERWESLFLYPKNID